MSPQLMPAKPFQFTPNPHGLCETHLSSCPFICHAAECWELPVSLLLNTSPRRESTPLQEYPIASDGAQANVLNQASGFSVVKMRGEEYHAQHALEKNVSEIFDFKKGVFFQYE